MKPTDAFVIFVLTGIVPIAPLGCSRSKPPPKPGAKEAGRVHDAKHGFSIIPPQRWTGQGAVMGNFMSYLGPQEGRSRVKFNAHVHTDSSTPAEALAAVKRAMGRIMTDYQDMEEGLVTIGGKKGFFLLSKFVFGDEKLQSLQYFLFNGKGKVYVVTFSCPASVFDDYRATFENSARTVRLE